jgi:hypothetical protein
MLDGEELPINEKALNDVWKNSFMIEESEMISQKCGFHMDCLVN